MIHMLINGRNDLKIVRKMKNRILVSILSGMIMSVLFLGGTEQRMSLAWWGWLYPEYCFMEIENSDLEMREIKISFWLAKVLDW